MMLLSKLASRKPNYRNLATSRPLLPTAPDPPSSSPRFFSPPAAASAVIQERIPREVLVSFKEWFKTGNDPSLDSLFKSLEDPNPKMARVDGIRVTEKFVLEALAYGKAKYGILSCLQLFDWAGRQPGFHHTRATFHAIFKILAQAKLMPLMVEFLDGYVKQRLMRPGHGFQGTVVMGYALAGQVHHALHLFAVMRFHGLDLDSYVYNILLNALVEERCFEAVDTISKHIFRGGLEDEATHSIMVKKLCKQGRVEEAEAYLRGVGYGNENGRGLSVLVDTLCQGDRFDKAEELMREFEESGVIRMGSAYGAWLKNLVRVGRVGECFQFLEIKKLQDGFVPDASLYNFLLFRLLKLNRAEDVCNLLFEMQESGVFPNRATMSAAFCFFCKAGMANIALDLYQSKSEFGSSPDSMAYTYLINSLCFEGSIDKAYLVLEKSADKGYFPGRNAFLKLANALCRERKLDKMKGLFFVASKQKFVPSDSVYDKFIYELCRARRVDDGFLIFSELCKMNRVARRDTYASLIRGFGKSDRGDIAARLLVEMQEKGYTATRSLFRTVTGCLLRMENPEKQFLKFLEMQLHQHGSSARVYNFFIEGAGRMKKPELARNVFEMMQANGIQPNLSSDILMLQSYLKSERISDALKFVEGLQQRRGIGRKVCNTMVGGLCQVNRVPLALNFMESMEHRSIIPSCLCYDAVIYQLCKSRNYSEVVKVVYDLANVGRRLTCYAGNVLLSHSISSGRLFENWDRFMAQKSEVPASISNFDKLIHIFSARTKVTEPIETLERMIEQCFPMNLYTYNMLMKRLSMDDVDLACKVLDRMAEKGWQPNKWAFHIIVHGYIQQRRQHKASEWLTEMEKRGFDSAEITRLHRYHQFTVPCLDPPSFSLGKEAAVGSS